MRTTRLGVFLLGAAPGRLSLATRRGALGFLLEAPVATVLLLPAVRVPLGWLPLVVVVGLLLPVGCAA